MRTFRPEIESGDYYRKAIADLTGVPVDHVFDAELRDIYQKHLAQEIKLKHVEKYFPQASASFNREEGERFNNLLYLVEGLFDLPIEHLTFGIFMPSYISAMADNPPPRSLLLAGAMTRATVTEFMTFANQVNPLSEKAVLDIENAHTEAKTRELGGTFYQGDATNMGFDSQFDVVTTNVLLAYLVMGGLPSGSQRAQYDFLKSAYTALRPNGQFVGVEFLEAQPGINYRKQLRNDLRDVGFRNIAIEPAYHYMRRRLLDNLILDPTMPVTSTDIYIHHRAFVITACKGSR